MNNKKIVDYMRSDLSMADLIISQGVSLRNDFTKKEKDNLKADLEAYMKVNVNNSVPKDIDLKKFILRIQGADEAGHLYSYLMENF